MEIPVDLQGKVDGGCRQPAIAQTLDPLAQHPGLGRAGRVQGTRELVVANTPYLVPYCVRNNVVEILGMFPGARKWLQKF